MGQISSFNMKKSTNFQVFHNGVIRPKYAIGGSVECNRKGYEALKLKEKIIDEAKQAYIDRTKRAFQAKSYEWSAVCNIKPDTTMDDLEKLAEHFFKKYGFQCYQIAIHRDEGHIDENGEKQINHHAHMEFITLDKETGKNRQREIKPQTLRQIQTEVAEILEMERGVDKRISKAKRIEPRAYAQLKEEEKKKIAQKNKELQEKEREKQELTQELETNKEKNQKLEQELLSEKEIKKILEAERKKLITENKKLQEKSEAPKYNAETYKELREIKNKHIKTKDELEKAIKEFREKHTKKSFLGVKTDFEAVAQEQEQIIYDQANQLNALNKALEYEAKIKALESDLNNERIKNDESQAKNNKNENKAISNDLNNKIQENITNSLAEAIGMRDYESVCDSDGNYIEQNQNIEEKEENKSSVRKLRR